MARSIFREVRDADADFSPHAGNEYIEVQGGNSGEHRRSKDGGGMNRVGFAEGSSS